MQISELKNSPLIFQVSKCNLCSQPLELPSVHFMCKHSYHARCLGENDVRIGVENVTECPQCGPEHRMLQDMLLNQEINANPSILSKRVINIYLEPTLANDSI